LARICVGVDIEEVARFSRLIRNKRFLKRVYTPQEIAYCRSKKNHAQHFAVRFAAKEAVWKAVSDALRKKKRTLSHREIGLKNDSQGRPLVLLPQDFSLWTRRISVSLSHTKAYVVASVVFSS
jgi:holo-[acyl-carrier protein] synthase